MADLFVSYSRRDSEFVRRLTDSVSERGKEVWLDTDGIADGEVFPEAIKRAIEQSDAFVFVITPASVASAYCDNEVEYARELQKRIVPVLRDPVSDAELPAEIRDRNWIPFTEADEFDASMGRLVAALDTDLAAAKAHTRWLVKALEWEAEARERSFLLRGSELKAAEAWLAASPEDADPAPAQLQREYLLASRESAARRQRLLVGASMVVAAISVGLLVFAVISRSQAVSSQVGAQAAALAAESQAQLPNDPEISLILGEKAVRTRATPQTLFALRAALDQSPFERAYPTVPSPGSCGFNAGLTLVVSPDGRQIAEGTCTTRTLFLLDAASGRVIHRLRTPSPVVSLAYAPGGGLLAVGTEAQLMLVNPRTGTVVADRNGLAGVRVATPNGPGVAGLAFSPNGRELAATGIEAVELWSVPALRRRKLAHYAAVGSSMAFSHDGSELIVGGSYDNAIRVYDPSSGRLLRTVSTPGGGYELLAVSPDGSTLAVGYDAVSGLVDRVSIYSTRTWARQYDVTTIPYVQISALAFSPDSTRLAVGAEDGTAEVWSLPTREKLVSYAGATAAVTSMGFTRDGRSVLTASNDGSVRLWRALGVEQGVVQIPANIGAVGISGQTLTVTAQAKGATWLYHYRLPGGRLLNKLAIGGRSLGGALSADGRIGVTFVAANQQTGRPSPSTVRVYDIASSRQVRALPNIDVMEAGLSRDGSLIYLLLQKTPSGRPTAKQVQLLGDGTPEIVSVSSGRIVPLQPDAPCGFPPNSIAFSNDGRRVAAGSFCGYVDVWSTTSGRLLRQVNEGAEISSVDLNANGSRLLVGSWDSRATIWSIGDGRVLRQLIGHTRGINNAVFAAGGALAVTASLDDTVRVWDAHTGAQLRVLEFTTEQGPIVPSPDGREMAITETTLTFGADDDVRVFDTCPACQNAGALLKQAAPHTPPPRALTELERTVVNGAR